MSEEKNYEQVQAILADADMILVSIGEEFDAESYLQENQDYCRHCEEIAANELHWVMPYLQYYYLKNYEPLTKACMGLANILEGKNYFILSASMCGVVSKARMTESLKKERLVELCGTWQEHEVIGRIDDCIEGRMTWKEFTDGRMSTGDDFEFYSLYSEKFSEKTYQEKWDLYLKWLQGTLNRKLCVLELGVGMRFLKPLRMPLEKVVEINHQAHFIRVHTHFYQPAATIAEKSAVICENAIVFMEQFCNM